MFVPIQLHFQGRENWSHLKCRVFIGLLAQSNVTRMLWSWLSDMSHISLLLRSRNFWSRLELSGCVYKIEAFDAIVNHTKMFFSCVDAHMVKYSSIWIRMWLPWTLMLCVCSIFQSVSPSCILTHKGVDIQNHNFKPWIFVQKIFFVLPVCET